ncbi:SH2 domain containing protein [Ectocarpus siliculosus]|uniref:SH2 domain containing protein n=1 Tax=Ectocarpus siliculosus TaxID=2880 RepID=D7FNY6_ECTSI|nr:SH2 domain containing protein [Ectocarpus siliculosus]|eukprot:CBJ30255.1 SH2 domain containing protein [Ectocarpus siliculosus]
MVLSLPASTRRANPDTGEMTRLGFIHAAPLVRFDHNRNMFRELKALRTCEELEFVRNKLRGFGRQIKFRAEVANAMNLTRLLHSGCLLLHYAGHGNDEYLAFESTTEWKCGIMEPLKVKYLKNLFRVDGIVKTQLVFISSCSSEASGNVFVAAGVPHVVAVKHNAGVTDGAAREFANVFYNALFENGGRSTVKQAFDMALNCVNATHLGAPKHEEDLFLLLPRDGNHDVRIFDTLPEGKLVDETHRLPPRPPCKKAVSSYMGPARVQHVVRLLLDERAACVTVTGDPGSGKTELAIQACDYVRYRHHFNSFLWADCDKAALDASPYNLVSSADRFYVLPNSPNGASGDSVSSEDLCRQIGVAIGIPQPGPSTTNELHQFIFPNTDSGQPSQKVLLVLDNVDSLLERGGDAQDRLVHLLGDLCSMGGGGHLKLLATSEYKLLSGNEVFHGGTERVAEVEPLETRHASELLIDNSPRDLQPEELGLQSGGLSKAHVVSAAQNHPVLKEVLEIAGGHPGTLVRLAPVLLNGPLDDACKLKEMATSCRADFRDKSYRRRGHRRSGSGTSAGSSSSLAMIAREMSEAGSSLGTSAPTSRSQCGSPAPATPSQRPAMGNAFSEDAGHGRDRKRVSLNRTNSSIDGSGGGGGGAAHAWPFPPYPDEEDGGGGLPRAHGSGPTGRCRNPRCHGRPQQQPSLGQQSGSPPGCCLRHQFAQELRDRVAMMHRRQMMAREALEEQPELPQMNMEQQHAWDMAEAAGVERGCRLLWVTATSNMANDWRRDNGGGGGNGWWASKRGEFVSWNHLREGLQRNLDVRMTVPCSSSGGDRHDALEGTQYTYLDDGQEVDSEEVEVDNDEDEDEEDQERAAGGERRTGNRRMGPLPHATRVLDRSQWGFIRGILRKKQKELANAGVQTVDCTEYRLDGRYDFISVETFAKFSRWWVPLMGTLGIIRNDWARTRPVFVHGFIGRLETDENLRRARGAFLLRFSESHPGKLVISRAYHHSLVEVTEGGRCYMTVNQQGTRREYESLHDLVTQNGQLRHLYQDIPMEQVFTGRAPAAPETETEGAPEARRENGYELGAAS